jgi:signal recognition particle GTPase
MVFNFLKSKLTKQPTTSPDNTGIFSKLKHKIKIFFSASTQIDESLFEQIEDILISADVGIQTTERLIATLKQQHKKHGFTQACQVVNLLKSELLQLIMPLEQPLIIANHTPFVILMIGINGAGKTTTIAKLAHKYTSEHKKVMLATPIGPQPLSNYAPGGHAIMCR